MPHHRSHLYTLALSPCARDPATIQGDLQVLRTPASVQQAFLYSVECRWNKIDEVGNILSKSIAETRDICIQKRSLELVTALSYRGIDREVRLTADGSIPLARSLQRNHTFLQLAAPRDTHVTGGN